LRNQAKGKKYQSNSDSPKVTYGILSKEKHQSKSDIWFPKQEKHQSKSDKMVLLKQMAYRLVLRMQAKRGRNLPPPNAKEHQSKSDSMVSNLCSNEY
jgi:hypothetical protein